MPKKLTTKDFIEKAMFIHGNEYDYSKVMYIGNKDKVTIICKIHGEFEQAPVVHISQKSGCQECADILRRKARRDSLNDFVDKAKLLHGTKYSYDAVEYINSTTKVTIVCPIHKEFTQVPAEHLAGKGCKKCGIYKRSNEQLYSNEEYIKLANEKHNSKYDYTKVKYTGAFRKVLIVCPEHGEFKQLARDHTRGSGCPSCTLYGFNKKEKGVLYYLKITTDTGEILYKIGITNRTVNERFSLVDLSKIEIIKQKLYENGQDAYNWEQKMLRMYKKYKYKGPKVLDSGNTELFTEDVLALYYAKIK